MSAWQDARAAAFAAMVSSFGATVAYKSATAQCIATPKEWRLDQQRTDMMPRKPVTISVTRVDYLTFKSLGLQPRENLVMDGDTFQVDVITDDPADATVDFRCYLKV